MNGREALLSAFEAAVRGGHPARALTDVRLPTSGGRTVVISVGKAALDMGREVRARLHGPLSGVVVAREEELPADLPGLQVLGAAHPAPSEASVRAGTAVLEAVQGLRESDLVLCLISGGASALVSAPRGVSLQEKARLTRDLLACGADIHEINAVRKHLSRFKGGGLARAAWPARVVSLIVSDVVGDDLSTIASGPTAPDPTRYADALAVLDRYGLRAPAARAHLQRGVRGEVPETPKPGEPLFERAEHHVVASSRLALHAARTLLERGGWQVQVYSAEVTGSAREAAQVHARQAANLRPGQALLSGGETTTVVRPGSGRGGRNLEFLLALSLQVREVYALAADTDGIDGSSSAAGAILTPDTLERAAGLGLDPRAFLEGSDAHGFFAALGDLVHTGPTGTNVSDFRCILRPARA